MSQKTVTMIMHRLNARGGHERSTLEVLTRLSRIGWAVELVAFELDDWPAELPIKFHRVPKWHPPIQLIENTWFACYVFFWGLFRGRGERIFVTIGAAAAKGDLRIVQFVNSAYRKSVHAGIAHYPNTTTVFHRLYQRFYSSWESQRERRLLPQSKHLIAISNQVRQELQDLLGPDTPPISIVHHGTDHTPNKVRNLEGAVALKGDVPVVIFAGALERKGIDKALRALALIKDKPWIFGVLGDGQIFKWQEYAKQLGIGAKVKFFGFQTMEPYWQVADILLFPSTYEPFGLVITEAASHGLIPVASRECGAMELWTDRPAWLNLSAASSDSDWATAVDKLVTDRPVRENIAREVHRRFHQWDWNKVTKEYENVLDRILEARAS